ncbi:cytochrome P450 [Pseudarthrobacter sulfonivorans]|uniref:cytochrome P450 n=1 Tax=Pseudarthrobacter sulfonivorans TaxID=121292 RepID=UPI00168BBE10|nr:cytochrome P450 [Pseudarthrobacter sulfonivorans]
MSNLSEMAATWPPYSHELEWPPGLPAYKIIDTDGSQGEPYAHYAWMREYAPVMRAETDTEDVWLVSRYEDVRKAMRAPKIFSSEVTRPVPLKFLTLIDDPEHNRLRRIIARAFTPKSVSVMEEHIRRIGAERLASLLKAGGGDVAAEYSIPLSIGTISGILDVPATDLNKVKFWSDEMNSYFARVARNAPGTGTDFETTMEFFDYLQENLERLYLEKSEAVGGHLARIWKEGLLSDTEVREMCGFLFVAGHDTTSLLLSNAFREFAAHPELLPRIKSNPSDAALFVEELARYRGSVHRTVRRTTEAVEVAGTRIPAGAVVRLMIASAGRDSAMFPNGDVFDIDRSTEGHFGFGHGIHSCIGAPLARLETKVTTELIAEHVASLQMDEHRPVVYMAGNNLTVGPKHLHVALTPHQD